MSESISVSISIRNSISIIPALEGELEVDYDKRNSDEGEKKCTHKYDGQDDKKEQVCCFCSCLRLNIYVNPMYDIYFDDYL
jgi:hypothetical protein